MTLIQIVNLCLMTINIFLAIYILLWKNEINHIKENKIKSLAEENDLLRKELYKNYRNEEGVVEDFAQFISENTPLVITKYNIADFFERRRKQ